jgi:hypothetical protein
MFRRYSFILIGFFLIADEATSAAKAVGKAVKEFVVLTSDLEG